MMISSKDWRIHHNLMPGVDGNSFKVRGTVTVANPGIKATLEKARIQDKSFALNLELKLEQESGLTVQVITDQEACFEMLGDHSSIPWVNIFHEGKLLTTVTEVIITK